MVFVKKYGSANGKDLWIAVGEQAPFLACFGYSMDEAVNHFHDAIKELKLK